MEASQARVGSRQFSDHDYGFSLTHEHVTSPMTCKKAADSLRMPPNLEMKLLSEASTNHDHETCTPR